MIDAFAKAFAQLDDPAFRRPLWIGVAASAGVFVLLWIAVGWTLTHTALFRIGWLDAVVDVLGGAATLALTWLLFPATVSGVVSVLLDRVAEAVERRHYPWLPPAREQPLGELIFGAVKFLAVVIVLNLVALAFLLIPPVFPFVFYAINGYLLSRECFELVALRRVSAVEARTLWKRHRSRLFLAGVLMALSLTVPIANLLAPIVGTAAMVHLFEALRPRA